MKKKRILKIYIIIASCLLLLSISCNRTDLLKPLQETPASSYPIPGNNGTISFSNIQINSVTLNWSKATFNDSPQSSLQYKVYLSLSNNIDSDINAQSNGTEITSGWTPDINTISATGLSELTTYYFNIIVMNAAENIAAYTMTSVQTVGVNSPTPGNNGILSFSNIQTNSITINWTKATDNDDLQSSLQYRVFQSTSNNIDTVSNAETNGTEITLGWTRDINSVIASGLSETISYFFNVIVRDSAGQTASYAMNSQATLDQTAPTPGSSGAITFSNVQINSITLNWTKATDNVTIQSNLRYRAFRSTSNNVDTAANAQSNGTEITAGWTVDINTITATGLTASTNYYFNIIVMDEAGLEACYTMNSQTTMDTAKDITGFTILGQSGTIGANSINLTVPYGTDPSNLTPTITISGASVSPASGVAQNFSSPVIYTVTAADSSTKQYTVTVNVALNAAKNITGFSILGINGAIGPNNISLTVPFGTDPSSLTPTIAITGATVNPASGVAQNFSSPVIYTVTAANSSTKQYTVTVNVALNTAKDITGFTILGTTGSIGPNNISLTVPFGTDPSSLSPTIAITGTSVSPASGVAQNFSSPVIYTVTANDSSTKQYTVTVSVASNTDYDITQFTILGINGAISSNTVVLTVPYGTDVTNLTPTITMTGASVSPTSGVAQNFSSPVIYTVTASDSSTQQYMVIVDVALNTAKDITEFTILGITGTLGFNSIDLTVPYGTDPASLTPTFAITGASVSPTSGVPQDFSSPVVYTVTAADSSTKQYTVTVTVAPTVTVSNISTNCQLETGFIIGTANSSAATIAAVEVKFDGGSYATATGTTNWKMAIPSGASTWKKGSQHIINVRSRDDVGNYSSVISTTIRKATNKDVNGDGYADVGVGAVDYNSSQGRAYIYYGSSTGISASPATTITGEATSNALGNTMTFGDLNGDGYADFIIGSQYPNLGSFWGKAYIFYGGSSGIADANASAANFILLSAADSYSTFSDSLATGDANNDGYDDLAVGAPEGPTKVYIFYGGTSGISGTSPKRANLADKIISGSSDATGRAVAFGDINGDGYEDIAIGANMYTSWTGRVFIVHNTGTEIPGGSVPAIANTIFTGEATNNGLGSSSSVLVGDINGDGYADIIMGASGYTSDQGRVYIYHGAGGGIATPANIATSANTVMTGAAASYEYGKFLALGDVNRDGRLDLAVGAPLFNNYQGYLYVYQGEAGGVNTTAILTKVGNGTYYYMGKGIGFADLNGDGYSDLVGSEYGFSSSRGQIHIFDGYSGGINSTASATRLGETTSNSFGYSITP